MGERGGLYIAAGDVGNCTSPRPGGVIVGLDPATRASGFAVVAGDQVLSAGVYVAVGKPGGGAGHRIAQLAEIFRWCSDLMIEWQPAACAVETVYHGPNARTTIRLAEVGAAVRLAAHFCGVALIDITPAERCAAVGVGGAAAKAEVLRAVNLLFGLDLADHNTGDAVAIAAAAAAVLRARAMVAGVDPVMSRNA